MSEENMSLAAGAAPAARTVDEVTVEIVTLKRQAGQMLLGFAVEIGRRLVEVKELLPHGSWGKYLAERVEYSQSTANDLMRLFKEYGDPQESLFGAQLNSQTFGNLSYSKALALLALPSEEREEFAQEHDVEDMSVRELREAVRAKEEAEKKAEAAEQSRDKMAQDMAFANERMAGMTQELEEAARAAQKAGEESSRAEAELDALRHELEELKSRPVEVAVQEADPAKLEQARADARREAEESGEKKLEAARKKLQKAEEQAADAKRRAGEAAARAEELEKKLSLAADPAVAEFKAHFNTAQTEIEAMMDCLSRLEKNGRTEERDKLRRALAALADLVREKAG